MARNTKTSAPSILAFTCEVKLSRDLLLSAVAGLFYETAIPKKNPLCKDLEYIVEDLGDADLLVDKVDSAKLLELLTLYVTAAKKDYTFFRSLSYIADGDHMEETCSVGASKLYAFMAADAFWSARVREVAAKQRAENAASDKRSEEERAMSNINEAILLLRKAGKKVTLKGGQITVK